MFAKNRQLNQHTADLTGDFLQLSLTAILRLVLTVLPETHFSLTAGYMADLTGG